MKNSNHQSFITAGKFSQKCEFLKKQMKKNKDKNKNKK